MHERQAVQTFDAEALYEFWKFIRKRYRNSEDRNPKLYDLVDLAQKKPQDVLYTLKVHAKEAEENYKKEYQLKVQKFMRRPASAQKQIVVSKDRKPLYEAPEKKESEFQKLRESILKLNRGTNPFKPESYSKDLSAVLGRFKEMLVQRLAYEYKWVNRAEGKKTELLAVWDSLSQKKKQRWELDLDSKWVEFLLEEHFRNAANAA